MRTLQTIAVAVLALAVPAHSSSAEKDKTEPSQSSSSSQYKPPDAVAGKSLDQWIKELKHTDPSVRENAVRTLPLFGDRASKAIPDIIYMTAIDYDVSLRVNGCIALMNLKIEKKDEAAAVQALTKQLTDNTQAVVRLHAALALGRFEEGGKAAIPSLIAATKDRGSWEIRKAAVGSLARVSKDKVMGPDPRATAALLEALKDYAAKVRLEAVMAMGSMGKPTNEMTRQTVIRAMQNELRERDKTIAVWAYVSLMALDRMSEAYLAELIKFLESKDVATRTHAARALGMVGPEVKKQMAKKVRDLVAALVTVLKDPEASVAEMAAWSLGESAQSFDPGEEATSALTELTKDKKLDYYVKLMAAEALESIKGKKWTGVVGKKDKEEKKPNK
jgi:HEAT repeat protein